MATVSENELQKNIYGMIQFIQMLQMEHNKLFTETHKAGM